jgi:hypothetical protein
MKEVKIVKIDNAKEAKEFLIDFLDELKEEEDESITAEEFSITYDAFKNWKKEFTMKDIADAFLDEIHESPFGHGITKMAMDMLLANVIATLFPEEEMKEWAKDTEEE